MIRILGLDPGLRHTGWGVVAAAGSRLNFVAAGIISPPVDLPLAARLAAIDAGLAAVLAEFQPATAAIEEIFVNRNPQSALQLGLARGVVMLAPARLGLSVASYAANLVKKSIAGYGHASKEQMQAMVHILLPNSKPVGVDAADALAVAICHAHHQGAGLQMGAA